MVLFLMWSLSDNVEGVALRDQEEEDLVGLGRIQGVILQRDV